MAGVATINLGVGVVILLIVWSTIVLSWLLFSKSHSAIVIALTFVTALCSFILIFIPLAEEDDENSRSEHKTGQDADEEISDVMFVWKTAFIIMLLISVLIGMSCEVSQFWTLKVHGSHPATKKLDIFTDEIFKDD